MNYTDRKHGISCEESSWGFGSGRTFPPCTISENLTCFFPQSCALTGRRLINVSWGEENRQRDKLGQIFVSTVWRITWLTPVVVQILEWKHRIIPTKVLFWQICYMLHHKKKIKVWKVLLVGRFQKHMIKGQDINGSGRTLRMLSDVLLTVRNDKHRRKSSSEDAGGGSASDVAPDEVTSPVFSGPLNTSNV